MLLHNWRTDAWMPPTLGSRSRHQRGDDAVVLDGQIALSAFVGALSVRGALWLQDEVLYFVVSLNRAACVGATWFSARFRVTKDRDRRLRSEEGVALCITLSTSESISSQGS